MVLQEEDRMRQPSPREAVFIREAREEYKIEENKLVHELHRCKEQRARIRQQLIALKDTYEDLQYEKTKALEDNRYIRMLQDS